MADTLDASAGQLKPPPPQKPYLPVAGFWARGLAFVADAMLLGALFYILIFAAKEVLFTLGRWNMPLSVAVIILYFLIGDGPVASGRTVGKLLAGIRVTDYNGRPLLWDAVIVRTLIKTQVVIIQVPVILMMESLEQSTAIAYWQIVAALIVYSVTLLATLFFALHIGLSPLKQAPYDLLARSMVFKLDNMQTREAVIELYDSPPLLKRLRRAAVMWSSIISLGFFGILCWPLVRDSGQNNEYFQKERSPFLERFQVADLGMPQWPLLSPNPVEFVRLDNKTAPANGAAPGAAPPPAPAAMADASTTATAAANPIDIKVRLNYVHRGTGEITAETRTQLEGLSGDLMEWFYPWFYKNFGANARQANVIGFQIGVVRVIPIIIRPHREDMLVLEFPADPAMDARAEAQYVTQSEKK